MNAYAVIAIILILALVGGIVYARTEIAPEDYQYLAQLATANPLIIPQIRDAIREGGITRMSLYMIKSEHNGTRQATNEKFSKLLGAKGEDQTANTEQTKAVIALLRVKSHHK